MPADAHGTVSVEEFVFGRPTRRIEDRRLLQGLGRYTDDLRLPGAAHMVILRSPFAAARIRGIDTEAALALPGVLTVLTGEDAEADGLGTLHTIVERKRRDGSPMPRPPYRILALDAARFAGDAVAAIIAETRDLARDAAELVEIDYEELPSVTDAVAAAQTGAP